MSDAISGFEGWEENLNMGGLVTHSLHYLHKLVISFPKAYLLMRYLLGRRY